MFQLQVDRLPKTGASDPTGSKSRGFKKVNVCIVVPKSRLKTYGDRAFSVAAPKLWNELPLDLRSLVTINLFKKHLKTDLFKKAYNV